MKKLSHYDGSGRARMVDVSEKKDTRRTATAEVFVKIRPSVLKKLPQNPKGDPLEVARFAGIAAKSSASRAFMARPIVPVYSNATPAANSSPSRSTPSARIEDPADQVVAGDLSAQQQQERHVGTPNAPHDGR